MNYTALQVKTSYSILNSLNDIGKLTSLAVNYGYTSLAITDECNMFGVMEFYNECHKKGIKPIIGIELIINETKIILYAKNNKGYKNLIKLSTIISDRILTIDDLKTYADNLILVMPFFFFDESIYNIYEDKFIGYNSLDELAKISDKAVFISDVSYLNKEDHIYLDYMKMIKDGKTVFSWQVPSYLQNEIDIAPESIGEAMLKSVKEFLKNKKQ